MIITTIIIIFQNKHQNLSTPSTHHTQHQNPNKPPKRQNPHNIPTEHKHRPINRSLEAHRPRNWRPLPTSRTVSEVRSGISAGAETSAARVPKWRRGPPSGLRPRSVNCGRITAAFRILALLGTRPKGGTSGGHFEGGPQRVNPLRPSFQVFRWKVILLFVSIWFNDDSLCFFYLFVYVCWVNF